MINDHMEHIEDILLTDTNKAVNLFRNVIDSINENQLDKFSVKIDGSPAVIIGQENDNFFVSTKSFFNKTPKVYKSNQEIDSIENKQLQSKIRTLFNNYKGTIQDGTIIQGDLLFTNEDLVVNCDHQKKVFSFTPNLLTYKICQSVCEQDLDRTNIGVAWHTNYRREATEKGVRYHSEPIRPLIQSKKEVLNIFPTYQNICKERPGHIINLDLILDAIQAFQPNQYTPILAKFARYGYENTIAYKSMHRNILVDQFYQFVDQHCDKEKQKFKTQAKHNVIDQYYKDVKGNISENHLIRYYLAIYIKNILWRTLNNIDLKMMTPMLENQPWYHEGFVFDNVKIVNKELFSSLNHARHAKK